MTDKRPRILLTGAAGKIAQILIPELSKHSDLTLTDIRPLPVPPDLPFRQADIGDKKAMLQLCRGQDILLHLAAKQLKSSWEDILNTNISGIQTLFDAALESRIRRIVFASSIQVSNAWPQHFPAPAAPALPNNLYGASKIWGEALGSVYAHQHDMSVICLRIGWVLSKADDLFQTRKVDPSMVLSHKDLISLVSAAIHAPQSLHYAIVGGLSANRRLRLDPRGFHLLPGYIPKDDAYTFLKGYRNRLTVRIARAFRQLEAVLRGRI